jgi:hypothetical protein
MALLVTGLIANWGTARRNYVIATILGYAAVLAVTFVYFVPELMSIIQSSYSTTINADLTRRALTWQSLSLVRLGFLIVLGDHFVVGAEQAGGFDIEVVCFRQISEKLAKASGGVKPRVERSGTRGQAMNTRKLA